MQHVYPVNDLHQHDTESMNCQCGPKVDWKNSVIVHRSYDGREGREKHSGQLASLGADILAEISAVQRLMEFPSCNGLPANLRLRKDWIKMVWNYKTKKFRQCRDSMGEIRCLASAILVDLPVADRDKFMNEAFALGYVGWVNEMDERMAGGH